MKTKSPLLYITPVFFHAAGKKPQFPRTSSFILTLAASVWLCLPTASHAATLIVTSTDDTGAGSLRQTIAGANPGDTIVFDSSLAGQTIYLASGVLNVGTSLTIDATALPGGMRIGTGSYSSGVFQITSGNVVFNALTISYAGSEYAGAVYVTGGALTLNYCTVSNNINGSGIDNGATLVLNACTISGNQASFYGGGLYNSGTATLNNCTLAANTAGYQGGGIANHGTLILTNCILSGNSSAVYDGGGIYNGNTATLYNCVISNNTAVGVGGGISTSGTSSLLNLNGCTLSGNAESSGGAVGGGGGVSLGSGTAILNNCTVSGNTALAGAGGGGLAGTGGTLSLTNCTVSANTATNTGGYGGGIYNYNINSTTINLMNTIVAGNTASTASYNDIYNHYSSQSSFIGGDPQLAPLGNYGGSTQTMPPLPGSPVIDTGADSITNVLATDQRGAPRLAGLHVDIGAAEGIYNAAGAGVLTGATVLGNGSFQFNFTNYEDMNFRVFASTDITLPMNLWSNLGPAVAISAGSGQFQFTDAGATNSQQRFYRVTSP